jgi:hypothetical protein
MLNSNKIRDLLAILVKETVWIFNCFICRLLVCLPRELLVITSIKKKKTNCDHLASNVQGHVELRMTSGANILTNR